MVQKEVKYKMHWNEIRRIAKSKRANAFGSKPTEKKRRERCLESKERGELGED